MTRMLAGTRRDQLTKRVIFAMVANRALAATSKLACAGWVSAKARIDGRPRSVRMPATGAR